MYIYSYPRSVARPVPVRVDRRRNNSRRRATFISPRAFCAGRLLPHQSGCCACSRPPETWIHAWAWGRGGGAHVRCAQRVIFVSDLGETTCKWARSAASRGSGRVARDGGSKLFGALLLNGVHTPACGVRRSRAFVRACVCARPRLRALWYIAHPSGGGAVKCGEIRGEPVPLLI